MATAVAVRHTLNNNANPSSSRVGAKKFFFPRIMNEPVGRYSPVGAVLDTYPANVTQQRRRVTRPTRQWGHPLYPFLTCEALTHQALDTICAAHADDRHTWAQRVASQPRQPTAPAESAKPSPKRAIGFTVNWPACSMVVGGMMSTSVVLLEGLRTMHVAAPCNSACT